MQTRRDILAGIGTVAALAVLDGCATARPAPGLRLTPLRVTPDHITRINVCTRPFRAEGPRVDVERFGDKTIVHNYGHGGSGWSLSWGAGRLATESVLLTGERDVGVVGCGAIGLTTALELQRAGLRVTIYTKDLPPNVSSSLATGLFTPDSRIALAEHATPDFKTRWERMARISWDAHQDVLGLAGTPVEFIDFYFANDDAAATTKQPDARPAFAYLTRELIGDLRAEPVDYDAGTHNLGKRSLTRARRMMFNLSSYQRLLIDDFYRTGGKLEVVELRSANDFAKLREKVAVNCTGYGARAILGDTSVIPVRGQAARTEPDPDVRYGLFYGGATLVPRRDGLLFQDVGPDDYYGFNDATTTPDRDEAERTMTKIASLYATKDGQNG